MWCAITCVTSPMLIRNAINLYVPYVVRSGIYDADMYVPMRQKIDARSFHRALDKFLYERRSTRREKLHETARICHNQIILLDILRKLFYNGWSKAYLMNFYKKAVSIFAKFPTIERDFVTIGKNRNGFLDLNLMYGCTRCIITNQSRMPTSPDQSSRWSI